MKNKLKLYNSKSKKIEEFKSLKKNEVSIYSCGPTVYSRQHIGNLRSVIIFDILKRVLKYQNEKVQIKDVINITDVGHLVSDSDDGEDKMVKASKKENLNPFDIAKKYEKLYVQDLKKLNIIFPKFMPRATEHIKEQIDIIKEISKKDLTYELEDGIYFDTQKYNLTNTYGKLSNKNIDLKDLQSRVKKKDNKKHPFDFALWKFVVGVNENHIMKWKFNENKNKDGFPGWHIECSAMSKKYLGEQFDIHTGGIEHITIHHEAEIAQNESSCKNSKISFWMHNQHLLLNNEKMSKSLGNILNLDDLENKNYDDLDFRFLCLKFHYRNVMNFTFEELDKAKKELKKIREFTKSLS